jgi:hypothetical protein
MPTTTATDATTLRALAKALEAITVRKTTSTVTLLQPWELSRWLPANTPDKAERFRALWTASRALSQALAQPTGTARTRAVAAAQAAFDRGAADLQTYLDGLLPTVLAQDAAWIQLRAAADSAAAQLTELRAKKAALALRKRALAASEQATRAVAAREAQLRASLAASTRRVPVTRSQLSVTVDGEVIALSDHVEAYSCVTPTGLVGRAQRELPGAVATQIAQAPIGASVKKILTAVASNEGGFSSINTYDKAIISWGFVQWTGPERSALTQALTLLKEVYPSAFATRFVRYGIDVASDQLVLTQGDGTALRGRAAALAIQGSPKLTAVVARAGLDPSVQRGQIEAAVKAMVDGALGTTLSLSGLEAAPPTVRLADVVTSELGVAIVVDRTVNAGRAFVRKVASEALGAFVRSTPGALPVGDGAARWSGEAERAVIAAVTAGWTQRVAPLTNADLNPDPGTFQRWWHPSTPLEPLGTTPV